MKVNGPFFENLAYKGLFLLFVSVQVDQHIWLWRWFCRQDSWDTGRLPGGWHMCSYCIWNCRRRVLSVSIIKGSVSRIQVTERKTNTVENWKVNHNSLLFTLGYSLSQTNTLKYLMIYLFIYPFVKSPFLCFPNIFLFHFGWLLLLLLYCTFIVSSHLTSMS